MKIIKNRYNSIGIYDNQRKQRKSLKTHGRLRCLIWTLTLRGAGVAGRLAGRPYEVASLADASAARWCMGADFAARFPTRW